VLDSLDAASPCREVALGKAVRSAALPVAGMTVTGPLGTQVTGEYPSDLRGASIARRDLDLLLLEAAVAAGASFECGVDVRGPATSTGGRVTGVRAPTANGERLLPARIVIAADGRRSRVASALGLTSSVRCPRRWAFGAYFSDVAGTSAFGEMHIRPSGYIGVAPLPGGLTNVCVVRALGRGARLDERVVLREAVDAEPTLRHRFAAARQVSPTITLGPLAVESVASGIPGLLLAGDAAGFVDPMTGDGLRFALRGGILAAEAALAELESGRPGHTSLHVARAREFSFKWRINRTLRSIVGSPPALRTVAVVAGVWSAPVQYLIGIAGDVGLARAQVVAGARR
jgi:flavin-dependent dehydrogenase